MVGLISDLERAKDIALLLHDRFNREGIFGHRRMPESGWGSNLTTSGIVRGSYEHLMFITLVVSIDYPRDADQLWEAGRKTFKDEETRWLFFPKISRNRLSDIAAGLRKHNLSKKPKKDPEIWQGVSNSLFELGGACTK